jgi:lipoprotein-releasing system ATP-binding protein
MDDKVLVQASGLYKEYGAAIVTRALDGVSLTLNRGEFSSIIGQSGCGKSTLLNMLGALDQPTRGSVVIDGLDLSSVDDDQVASFRNKTIGFIFQSHYLLTDFTALENVLIPTWIQSGIADRQKEKRAKELLEIVGLQDRMNNPANNLSGGQQQRVAIARALINDPKLVLADEPTGNLDSDSTEQVYELLRRINRESSTAFTIVTHDRHIAEKSDRVIEMKDGRIIDDYLTSEKTPSELWACLGPGNCKLLQQLAAQQEKSNETDH